MRVTPQGGPPKGGGARQVPCSPPLKHTTGHMLGCGSAGKFYFLSLLANQLAPWIGCVFHDNNKVHRANEALKQLGFAICLTQSKVLVVCQFFYNYGRSFAGVLPSY